MRVNQFVARATGLSRRAADRLISEGRVMINGQKAVMGSSVDETDEVTLDSKPLRLPAEATTIMLNKPTGYVCSRAGQGSKTVYELLPPELHRLKPVGRLDKDSSGLLLMTDDGDLADRLTHPRHDKSKVYEITLDEPLRQEDMARLEQGVRLDDGLSRPVLSDLDGRNLTVTLSEGRNRQIRRTFAALGYTVTRLHRIRFGPYRLEKLAPSEYYRLY